MKHPRPLTVCIALLLAAVLCFAPLGAPVATFAAEAFAAQQVTTLHEGTCGSEISWTLDSNGTFTLSGSGHMLHYTGPGSGDAPWLKYHDQIRTVVIEEGITGIGNYAFFQCTGLERISLPQSLTAICDYAFWGCTKLTEVTFPDGLQAIRHNAFADCGLTSVTLPASLTELGSNVFARNTSLRTAMLMGPLSQIPSGTFSGCAALEELFLSSAITHIASFDGCKSLRNVYYTGTTTQWHEIHLPTDKNDPLNKANITFHYRLPSDVIDSTGISAKFYTTTPVTALRTGETRDLLVQLFKNGERLSPSDGPVLNTLHSGIISNGTLPDGWQFTFKAGHDTYNDVKFYIPGTYFEASTSFYTFDGTHTFHCFDPWMPDISRSTLQMGNFRCDTPAQHTSHTLSFDAYNTGYSWGAVIANDGSGSPGEVLPVPSKINDGSDIIVNGQRYMAVHPDGQSGTAYPVYIEFPHDNQQVCVTTDGSDTVYPALFTAIHIFTRWAMGEAGIALSGTELQAVSLAMMNWVTDAHLRDTVIPYGQRLHTRMAAGDTPHTLISEVYMMYAALDVNLRDALRLGLVSQKPELANIVLALPDVPPSEESFADALRRDPELSWSAMDYAFNLNRGSTRIAVRREISGELSCAGHPLWILCDRPFDRFTVLEAAQPVSAIGLDDALTQGLSDGMLYSFRLLVKGKEYNPATAFELPHRTMRVVLELPEKFFRQNCAVYRINADGTRTFVHADIQGRTAAFDTDCTGTYLVGVLPPEKPMPALLVVVLVVMLGASVWCYRKKYPKTENEDE